MIKTLLKKKTSNWGLAYNFRSLIYYCHSHHGREHCDTHGAGVVAEGYILIYRPREGEGLGLAWAFENLSSETLPPTCPYLFQQGNTFK